MSSPARSSVAWWAPSVHKARGTAVGGIAITLALVTVGAIVWVSPTTSPVTQVSQLAEALAQSQRLIEERDSLNDELSLLEEELAARDAEVMALQQELASASGDLDETEAALEEAEAVLASTQLALEELSGREDRGSAPKDETPSAPASPTEPVVTAPPLDELVAPESPYFGLYTEQAPFNFATFDATGVKVGAQPNMVGYFQGWDKEFRPDAVTAAWKRGLLPMMTWESRPIDAGNDTNSAPEYSLPLILDGAFDDYLHGYAEQIVELGLPLAIRFNHEMNGNWYPWSEDSGPGQPINGNRPGDYAKVWRYVHDIFEQEGANELVIWVWAPNRVNLVPTSHRSYDYLASLYPGDDYVDWVGMSGYLRPPVTSSSEVSFDATYGMTLDQLRQLTDKPIILAEVGATETGGRKAEWVTDFFAGLNDPENSDIIGFAWFSLAVTTFGEGGRTTNDWRIDSRADSLAAFSEGLLAEGSRFDLRPPG